MMQVTNNKPYAPEESQKLTAGNPVRTPKQEDAAAQAPQEGDSPAAVFSPSIEAKASMAPSAPAAGDAASSDDSDSSDGKKTYSSSEKVDQEIQKLKNQQSQLQSQVNGASDPDKKLELQQQLQQVQQQLALKDTDSYRRQHATFWEA